MAMLGNILWRFKCPKSVAEIARHFVDNYTPKDQIGKYDFETAYIDWEDPWFAHRRMIGSIYGVAVCYKPPDDSPTMRGWNRQLWKEHETLTPDELVETIFDMALERLKQLTVDAQQPAEQGADGNPH